MLDASKMNPSQIKNMNDYSQIVGKTPIEVVTVVSDGTTFSICGAYERECKALGLGIGSMCCDDPRALSMTASYIAKWRNIPFSDYEKMDGFVLCDDNRNGKIAFIVLF